MQIKAYAIKNDTNKMICSKKSKIIMKMKNKILLLQNLIKKALLALWLLTVEELRKLIFSSRKQGNAKAFLWWNRAALDGSTFFLV